MNIGRHNYTQQNKGKNVNANDFVRYRVGGKHHCISMTDHFKDLHHY